jgi:hypothetical protein
MATRHSHLPSRRLWGSVKLRPFQAEAKMVDPSGQSYVAYLGLALKGAETIKNLVTTPDAKKQAAELFDIILTGQQSALEENIKQRALLEEVRELKQHVAKLEAWDAEKQRYALAPPWHAGVPVYALKQSAANGEPPHYICTHCYQDRRKSILNDRTTHPAKGAQGHAVLLLECDRLVQGHSGPRSGANAAFRTSEAS